MAIPVVTVLMPVYNAANTLAAAVESILRQTFHDFEFIIVNDGSTDSSGSILEAYAQRDQRISIIGCPTRRGIVASLNDGVAAARSIYIARMDADDVAVPHRVSTQVDFLNHHPACVLAGSWARGISRSGEVQAFHRVKTGDAKIKAHLLVGNQFIHSTVMMRRDAVVDVGGYRTDYPWNEDYDLWLRLSSKYQIANIPNYLMDRHVGDPDTISSRHRVEQQKQAERLRQIFIRTELPQLPNHGERLRMALRINPWDTMLIHSLPATQRVSRTRLAGWRLRARTVAKVKHYFRGLPPALVDHLRSHEQS